MWRGALLFPEKETPVVLTGERTRSSTRGKAYRVARMNGGHAVIRALPRGQPYGAVLRKNRTSRVCVVHGATTGRGIIPRLRA